ncbi:hypothetical protein IH779_00945 [Patescibacteria group bacterium]|nr:hypothetical protein [Patescibacteria group bacterium]
MKALLEIDPRNFDERQLSEKEILQWFDLCDAVWLHDGDSTKPHAELISGMCSDGYFDCSRVLCYPNITEILARQLVQKLRLESTFRMKEVDWVVGSAYAAITFSYEVAKALGAIHGFTEKEPTDLKGKIMVWRRQTIPARSQILQIEELITTAHTMNEVGRAVKEGNSELVNFMPIVGALIHRPPVLPVDYGDTEVVALIEKEVWTVNPKDCHLCQAGSPRYRPKTHWQELTGKK